MSEPVSIDAFHEIAALVRGYELQPGKHYLILAGDRDFSFERLHALMATVREEHPELIIMVVASTKAMGVKVMEENETTN